MPDKTEKDLIYLSDVQLELKEIYNELYSLENTKRVLTALSEGETLEEIGRKMGVTRERVRQIEAKAIKKFCLWQIRNRILLKVCASVNSDRELSCDTLREYFGEYYSKTVFLLHLCENPTYHYDSQSDSFIIDKFN